MTAEDAEIIVLGGALISGARQTQCSAKALDGVEANRPQRREAAAETGRRDRVRAALMQRGLYAVELQPNLVIGERHALERSRGRRHPERENARDNAGGETPVPP